MSTPTTVTVSDIAACPKTILRPQHYVELPGGAVMCRCQEEPIARIAFEQALSHLTFSLGAVTGAAMRLRDTGGEIRASLDKHLVNLEGLLKNPDLPETDREVLITASAAAEWVREELNRLALAGPEASDAG